jgi:hypothetical protein
MNSARTTHIQTRTRTTFNSSRKVIAAVVAIFAIALTVLGIASADTTHATAKLCGANTCADLSPALAAQLSGRIFPTDIPNDTFSLTAKPKPHPYYKVRITGDGTVLYISKLIVWVPSKHLLRVKEYVRPALAPYWRTGNAAYENQFAQVAQARKLTPFPASGRYR